MDIQKRNNDKEIYAPLKSKWLVMKPEEDFSRNPKIAAFLKAYHFVKEFGEGFDRI